MNKKLQSKYKIITALSQWQEVCVFFEQCPWLGLDTEFMRERTYYPQLCLVQLACDQVSVCLDPLAFDIAPILSGFLRNQQIVKILHSSSQDIEVLGQYCDEKIDNLFDTQLAAEFSGMESQIGYAAIVHQLTGVELPKSQTRSNWAKRPLTQKQIEYSINDVVYLKPLYDILSSKLDESTLMGWFVEEQQNELKRMGDVNVDPQKAYLNIKASHRLNTQAQQLIKALVNWREKEAQTSDLPRHWIIKDKTVTEIATLMPKDANALATITREDPRFSKKYNPQILKMIEESNSYPDEAVWSNRLQLSENQKQQVNSLRDTIADLSACHNLPSTRLATKKDMVEFVQSGSGRLAQGWRAQVLNK